MPLYYESLAYVKIKSTPLALIYYGVILGLIVYIIGSVDMNIFFFFFSILFCFVFVCTLALCTLT